MKPLTSARILDLVPRLKSGSDSKCAMPIQPDAKIQDMASQLGATVFEFRSLLKQVSEPKPGSSSDLASGLNDENEPKKDEEDCSFQPLFAAIAARLEQYSTTSSDLSDEAVPKIDIDANIQNVDNHHAPKNHLRLGSVDESARKFASIDLAPTTISERQRSTAELFNAPSEFSSEPIGPRLHSVGLEFSPPATLNLDREIPIPEISNDANPNLEDAPEPQGHEAEPVDSRQQVEPEAQVDSKVSLLTPPVLKQESAGIGGSVANQIEGFLLSALAKSDSRSQSANRSETKTLQIKLEPDSLGTVNVEITRENDQISVKLAAENEATVHILQRELSELQERITSAEPEVLTVKIDVQLASISDQSHSEMPQSSGFDQAGNRGADDRRQDQASYMWNRGERHHRSVARHQELHHAPASSQVELENRRPGTIYL